MLKVYRLATICCQRKAPIAAAIQLVGTKCVSTSLLANKFHSNGYYLNYQPITIRRFAQKIPFPTSKSEPGISFTQNTTGRRVTPFGWLLLVCLSSPSIKYLLLLHLNNIFINIEYLE